MDWVTGLQRAIDYVEENLDGEIDCAEAAGRAYSSAYHFQRAFSLVAGMTFGEYVRARRLTLASVDLRAGMRVIDVAVKFGYDSPDSFARAFARFHGATPTDARQAGIRLNACARLILKLIVGGGTMLDYRIENREETVLLGFRRRFDGAPYGAARDEQEERLMTSTRAGQYMLRGMTDEIYTNLVALTNVGDDGYDFWYAEEVDAWTRAHMYDSKVTGIDFMEKFGFEELTVPAGAYAVFKTQCSRMPAHDYRTLRRRVAEEWLPGSGCTLRDAPELALYDWPPRPDKADRFVEICLPVER